MKKISTLMATMLVAGVAFGQSQRLVLVEEFTGETCPPCAAQNPGFNALMDANSAKGISIKYQNDIPSAGPNFWPYNTVDVDARASFLGATGTNSYSPHGYMDGNLFDDVIGNFSASLLNTQYAVTSPFDVTVTHTLSALEDSVYTHTVVRATQAVSGNLSLRVVVVESEIFGYTSPNGENEYSNDEKDVARSKWNSLACFVECRRFGSCGFSLENSNLTNFISGTSSGYVACYIFCSG